MRVIILIILLSANSFAFSSDWISPIDIKYKQKNLNLFSKFDITRDLVNSWQGQGEKLILADKLLREILEEDPKFAPAYREYGRLYIMAGYVNSNNFKEGSLSLSEKSILKSIEIEPQYADAYVLLGHLYTKMGKYEEAQSALEKAELIGTRTPWLDLNWADLLNEQEKYGKALQRYINVVVGKTSDRKAHLSALSGITEHYQTTGDYEKAKSFFIKQIEYEPDSAWIFGNYASFLLFSYGDIDESIENSKKALEIMSYDMGRFILACALYTKWAIFLDTPSKQNDAQKHFDQAWSIYPHLYEVIEQTKTYKHTKITAKKLQDLLEKKQGAVKLL